MKTQDLGIDDLLPRGKYKGEQIEDVLTDDPEYLLWMAENTDITFDDEVNDHLARI